MLPAFFPSTYRLNALLWPSLSCFISVIYLFCLVFNDVLRTLPGKSRLENCLRQRHVSICITRNQRKCLMVLLMPILRRLFYNRFIVIDEVPEDITLLRIRFTAKKIDGC